MVQHVLYQKKQYIGKNILSVKAKPFVDLFLDTEESVGRGSKVGYFSEESYDDVIQY